MDQEQLLEITPQIRFFEAVGENGGRAIARSRQGLEAVKSILDIINEPIVKLEVISTDKALYRSLVEDVLVVDGGDVL